jgi:hypothetical protein
MKFHFRSWKISGRQSIRGADCEGKSVSSGGPDPRRDECSDGGISGTGKIELTELRKVNFLRLKDNHLGLAGPGSAQEPRKLPTCPRTTPAAMLT